MKDFLRFATEEAMRRHINQIGVENLTDSAKLLPFLFSGVEQFKLATQQKLKNQVINKFSTSSDFDFGSLEHEIRQLKSKLGLAEDVDMVQAENTKNDDQEFRLDVAVDQILAQRPWVIKDFVDNIRVEFDQKLAAFKLLCQAILKDRNTFESNAAPTLDNLLTLDSKNEEADE